MASMTLAPIGVIRTPFKTLDQCPRTIAPGAAPCRVEMFAQFADGLLGIEAASHLWLLYWLNQADRSRLSVVTPHDGVTRGVFANRSPARPNPIAIRAVPLLEVLRGSEGTVLSVGGMDCLDSTPLLDIKPYVPADRIAEASLAWMG